jgi:CubicO group peptidase (beta-lactamase class C family)
MAAELIPGFDELETVVVAERERHQVPGIAVGVLHDGGCEVRGYGVVSLESGWPVLPGSLFQIGSISKIFTTTLVMRLVDEGRLDLQRPLIEYLPDLRLQDEAAQRSITLWHLLTHTAGFDGDGFEDVPENGCDDETFQRVPRQLGKLRQWTRPGELFTYANIGFSLAGALACRVLSMPLEEVMRERVFAPLGLERSFYAPAEAIAYPMTCGHVPENGAGSELRVVREWYPWARWTMGDGGINAPAADLLQFAAFHVGDGTAGGRRILSAGSLRQMQTAQVSVGPAGSAFWGNRGLGWHIPAVNGPKVIEHGGGTHGWLASLRLVPERAFAIAILTNSTTADPAIESIARWALDRFCGVAYCEPEPVTIEAKALERMAGRYATPRDETAFDVNDGGLLLTVHGRDIAGQERVEEPLVLTPVSQSEFVDPSGRLIGFLAFDGDMPRLVRIGSRIAGRVDSSG